MGELAMSRKDIFSRYSQLYQKSRAREIVPEGPFVRQLTDVQRRGLDVGIFFKISRMKSPRQIYLGRAIPSEAAKKDGFLETDDNTFLSRTLLSKFRKLDYLKVVIGAGKHLRESGERIQFLKTCQRIIDVIARKARNVVHLGDFTPFMFGQRIFTLEEFLKKRTKLDEVGIEAAAISFNVAAPDYILMPDGDIIVFNEDYRIQHRVFHFAGGIGYTFDKAEGAVSEERVFRSPQDLDPHGIDHAHLESMMLRVREDFQNKVHSIIFADVWKKVKQQPVAINFGGQLLIKAEAASEIWTGVFEVYLASPKA